MLPIVYFITSRLPYPPNRGDKVRSYQFLRLLSQRYHVIPVSLYESKEAGFIDAFTKAFPEAILIKHNKAAILWNMFKALLSKLPFQIAYYQNTRLKHYITHTITDKTSPVFLHLVRMAPYGELIRDNYRIVDMCDCISMEYERRIPFLTGIRKWFYTEESHRLRSYERYVASHFNEIWLISDTDLRKIGVQTTNQIIVPNAVHASSLTFDYASKGKIMFIGNMSVPHNIHAVQTVHGAIMPTLLKKYPSLVFDVIGADPVESITKLEGSNATHIVGFVDDLFAAIREYDLFLAPLYYSAGIQNKVLEAMSAGLPVLITPNVAESIGCRDDEHCLIADDNAAFIRQTLRLLADAALRERIGNNGRNFIHQKYSEAGVSNLLYSRIEHALSTSTTSS